MRAEDSVSKSAHPSASSPSLSSRPASKPPGQVVGQSPPNCHRIAGCRAGMKIRHDAEIHFGPDVAGSSMNAPWGTPTTGRSETPNLFLPHAMIKPAP